MSAPVAGGAVGIVEGDDGWLFLRSVEGIEILRSAWGTPGWRATHLPKLVALFTSRRARLEARGIPYVVAIVPEKAHIYPEKLPSGFVVPVPTMAQLLTRACADAGIEAVDLTELLRSAKGPLDLYYRVDSHWTYYGAYVAYRRLVESIRKWVAVVPLGPHEVAFTDKEAYGDLGVHLTPERRGIMQDVAFPTRPVTPTIQAHDLREYAFAAHRCDEGHGRAIVVRDSFTTFLAPFLSRTFSETYYTAPAIAMLDDMIDELGPDIVIHQCSERALVFPPDAMADWVPRTWRQTYLEALEHPDAASLIRQCRQAIFEWRFDDAVILGRQLVARTEAPLEHNLAEAYVMAGAHAEALEICRQIESRRGADALVRFLKAHALVGLGDVDNGVATMREALALRPGHAQFLYLLGCWLSRGEEKLAGAEALWSAIQAAPAYVEAWRELAQVHTQLGNTDLASLARGEADRLVGNGVDTR